MRRLLLAALVALAPSLALAQANTGAYPRSQNALTNTAVALLARAGVLRTVNCANPNAAVTYLQFWDTTGAVSVGTTAPTFVLSLPTSNSFGSAPNLNFGAGLKVAATTGATNGTAPGAALTCTFGVN